MGLEALILQKGRVPYMIQVYKHSNGHLDGNISLAAAEKGSWINVVNPDSDDLQLVSMVTEIHTDDLKTALETE